MDRLIKTSLVHKSLYLKQSAVVSCVHLMKKFPENVRKLVGEAQTILLSGVPDLQFHSLLLLHEIKKQDPMGILKVLRQLTTS